MTKVAGIITQKGIIGSITQKGVVGIIAYSSWSWSWTYVTSGLDYYKKGRVGSNYIVYYSSDGGVTYEEILSLVASEDLIIINIDGGVAGYRQQVRDGALMIDHVLTETGFAGDEGTDWENVEIYATWIRPVLSELTAQVYSNNRIYLNVTLTGDDGDGILWERSEDGISYDVVHWTAPDTIEYSDIVDPTLIYYYRCRAFNGTMYSSYSNVVQVVPTGIRVNSANSSVLLADASNEFLFSSAGTDDPFSVLAIVKSNNVSATNILLTKGNGSGLSYNLSLNAADGAIDFALYNGNIVTNNLLYKKTSIGFQDTNINKIAFTYDGSAGIAGMKIYKNGSQPATYPNSAKVGTYTTMFNGTGMYIGREIPPGYADNIGNFDLYALLIVGKELSQAEVTEFQDMSAESEISELSFYADIKTINKFNGTLADDLGNHNGTSVAPTYIYTNDSATNPEIKLPSETLTTYQGTFENLKLGWFIGYGMETYADELNVGLPLAPSTFDVANVDVNAWATLAASYGKIDYATLTVKHAYGFSLFNHENAVWRGTTTNNGTQNIPTYAKYDVGATDSDKLIVNKFVQEFNAVNIKPILYFEIGYACNFTGNDYMINHYTDADYQFLSYHNILKEQLQELCTLTPFAIWIDAAPFYPLAYLKDLYHVVKEVDPAIGVIINPYTEQVKTDNIYAPFDCAATENNLKPALPSDTWWGKTQVIDGVTYPCVKELCWTSRANNRWFYNAASGLLSIVTLQAIYDYAKAAGVPCSLSVNPKLDGVIDQDQADLVGSIVL